MMDDTKITYKIISSEGHTEKEELASVAVADIKNLVESESKWLYVNKEHISDVNDITVDLLVEASNIMLTNTQAGG